MKKLYRLLMLLLSVSLTYSQPLSLYRKASANQRTLKAPEKTSSFVLKVGGVECPACAQSVIEIVQQCGGSHVVLDIEQENYENCSIRFNYMASKNPPLTLLCQKITSEGFDNVTIIGPFKGDFVIDEKTNQYAFKITDDSITVGISKDMYKKNRRSCEPLRGTLCYNGARKEYTLIN